MRAVPNVLSLEPGTGALAVLIRALMDGRLLGLPFETAPERLADLIVYVPNKRLKASFEAALIRELGPRPVILPRLRLLGAPGDALEALDAADIAALQAERRVMTPQERRFHLMPLVKAWREGLEDKATPTLRETLTLAGALGALIDEMILSDVPLARLASVAPPGYDPARFDAYWGHSRDFLRIAAQSWPVALTELGAVDAVAAQLAHLAGEAERLRREAPETPMLVLGSTGSVAATGQLMWIVSRLPHGGVVLPGLDTVLEEEAFALIGAAPRAASGAPAPGERISLATQFGHPQSMLKRTLGEIGVTRADVRVLRAGEAVPARLIALSDLLRPAETVARWRETRPALDEAAAFGGIAVIEAADEREEALAVALAMRETLETPHRTVALVTPDRMLARRVAIELRRWGIEAVDAAGLSLRESPAGVFLGLFLAAAQDEPGALMALMAHPLARFGYHRGQLEALAEALDLAVMRGHRFLAPLPLVERVRHAVAAIGAYAHPAVKRLPAEVLAELPALAKVLDSALAPFRAGAQALSLPAFCAALGQALEDATRDERGTSHLAASGDGGALASMLAGLAQMPAPDPVEAAALPAALGLLMSEQPLPPAGEEHPRAFLLGPFEARLIEADRVILGMLNEGRFPPTPPDDPFLNRAMRMDLGLQAPEWRLGASAHDFAQLGAHQDLILTRPKRMADAPALPSRFLRRLEAYAEAAGWQAMLARGARYLRLAHALDAPAKPAPPAPRPCPVPQAPRLPKKLSITDIETLRRDPYALYARDILGLVPLEPPGETIDGRDRGTLLHAILERYAASPPPDDPEAARRLLDDIAGKIFAPIKAEPELYYFWRRRFETIAPGFIDFDRKARAAGREIRVEVRGQLTLDLASGAQMVLSGKADRIERAADGALSIIDYKSGAIASGDTIRAGLAPQLPITAAMARRGAFGATGVVQDLAHADVGGGRPFTSVPVKSDALESLIEEDFARLLRELDALASGAEGYLAQKAPKKNVVGAYDHLARRALWGEAGGEDDDEDEGAP